MSKEKKKKYSRYKLFKKQNIFEIIIVKLILIAIFVGGFYYNSDSFSNEISLLAVNEANDGEIYGGSIITLGLEKKRGTGQIHVNLNTIEDIDTQISIINSQKIACDLFELDCENYDFYYKFDSSALLLKGPSASSAIAILVAKTINEEKINEKIAITGSLNSGGIIGNVGGVEQKIKVAQKNKFTKVLIPAFTPENEIKVENFTGIKVNRVLDIVEAYNEFNGNEFEIKTYEIKKDEYNELMKSLAKNICDRYENQLEVINISLIKENSTEEIYLNRSKESFEYSNSAMNLSKYYSAGSFCYNANINAKIIINMQSNISEENIDQMLNEKQSGFNIKMIELNTDEYQAKIKTINDFYSYIVLQDRIDEARETIKTATKIKFQKINKSNNDTNETQIKLRNGLLLNQKINLLSNAEERFETVLLWENFITNQGNQIIFNDEKLNNVCNNIQKQVTMKTTLLESYNINVLNEEITKFNSFGNPFSNNYLCIYKGLELNGKINTILNSIGISDNSSQENIKKIVEFTKSRLSLNSNGDFPLIPYIYTEYSEELLKNNDLGSAMLYANNALSYLDLNIFLEEKKPIKSVINLTLKEVYSNSIFLIAFLVLIAF